MYKYFIEYLGVLVIMTAILLTESDPVIMGLTYFSVLTITHNVSNGYLNPFAPIAMYILGRDSNENIFYNLVAQIAGGLSSIVLFKPIKTYID